MLVYSAAKDHSFMKLMYHTVCSDSAHSSTMAHLPNKHDQQQPACVVADNKIMMQWAISIKSAMTVGESNSTVPFETSCWSKTQMGWVVGGSTLPH